MTTRKLICMLLAAMMLTGLSGCGGNSAADRGTDDSSRVSRRDRDDDDEEDDSKDDSSSRGDDDTDDSRGGDDSRDDGDTDPGSHKTPDDGTPDSGGSTGSIGSTGSTGSRSDYEAAKAVLEKFFNAVQDGDRDDMLSFSDLGKYFELCQMIYEYQDDEDPEDLLEDIIDELFDELLDNMRLESYTIGDGALRNDLVQAYKKSLAEYKAEFEEEYAAYAYVDEDDAAEYELFMQVLDMFPTMEKLYVFPVTMTAGGETSTEYIKVAYEDGAWKADTVFVAQTIGYSQKYTAFYSNTRARMIYTALMSALVDMDCEDLALDLITGKTYTFKGSDFEDLTEPASKTTADDLLQMLKYRVSQYFTDITELEEISFILENDCTCPAVAVKNGTMLSMTTEPGELPVFGSYPAVLGTDDLSASLTLESVLAKAKAENDG